MSEQTGTMIDPGIQVELRMIPRTFLRGLSFYRIAILIICLPAAAGTAVIYGSSSGFLPERHPDIDVIYTLPGQSGGLFDSTVADFTDRSVNIIFIGNDAEFSSRTAAAIEEAVWDGRVLVIGYPATARFSDSLPLSQEGTAEGGGSLVVSSLNNGIAREVFSGLNRTFAASEPVTERLTGSEKTGAISLMKFNTGEPALLYRQYGHGYVVQWMLATPQTYLGTDDADTVNYRIVSILSAAVEGAGSPVTTAATTTVPTTVATTAVTTITGSTRATTASTTGNAIIQSSPLGARTYIDGIYAGETPLQLNGIPEGYHAVRMSMTGYYDFDGSAYIVSDETITVFGSLQERGVQTAATATARDTTPVETATPELTVPATAAASGQSDALSNPTVIAAGIGIITAGIGAYATIYTHRNKDEPKKKE